MKFKIGDLISPNNMSAVYKVVQLDPIMNKIKLLTPEQRMLVMILDTTEEYFDIAKEQQVSDELKDLLK
jgi:hypothetical protein